MTEIRNSFLLFEDYVEKEKDTRKSASITVTLMGTKEVMDMAHSLQILYFGK